MCYVHNTRRQNNIQHRHDMKERQTDEKTKLRPIQCQHRKVSQASDHLINDLSCSNEGPAL